MNLPGIGAIGGMLVPALLYIWFNQPDQVSLKGWGILAVTDIAFTLGFLALIGSRILLL